MLETKIKRYKIQDTKYKLSTVNSHGFTLIDSLMAMSLIGIAIVLFGLLLPTLRISQSSRENIIVRSVLEKKLEELRSNPFDQLILQSGTAFTDTQMARLNSPSAHYNIEEIDINGDAVIDEDLKKITVVISWQNGQKINTKSLSTLIGKNGLAAQ